ncbi:MAG: class I SAM-dependent methyltransferase [Methylobacter sp.]
MNSKNKIKQVIIRLAQFPYLGQMVRIGAAIWRGPQTRAALEETRAALHQSNLSRDTLTERLEETRADLHQSNLSRDTLTENIKRLEAISDGYGAAIRGLENCAKRHEKSFGTLKSSLENKFNHQQADIVNNIRGISERIEWMSTDNDNIRLRIEFIRKELMFELRKDLKIVYPSGNDSAQVKQSRIVNLEKYNSTDVKRLNLGCGHIPVDDHINVDARELPGVDIIADVTSLPYESMSVHVIRAAHLIEHFSERALKDIVLPYWSDLLVEGGELNLIAPDAEEMINGYARGEFSFEELREVIFGGQEYDGDFHFTMLKPNTLAGLLKDVGFREVDVVESARRNGLCYEFEVQAKK